MATVYPGGTGITIVTNTNLEADDMTFMGTSIAGSPQQTDYSDVKAGIVGNPGALGGVTPATALSVAGDSDLNGSVVINEAGAASKDFRVEGDTETHLIFADASADYVGIANNATTCELDVTGSIKASSIIQSDYFNVGTGAQISKINAGQIDFNLTQDNGFLNFRCDSGQNGGLKLNAKMAYAVISAAASVTVSLSIPSGALLMGAQFFVVDALTGGELWDAEWNDGSTLQSIATAQAVAQGTAGSAFFNANAATAITDASTDIIVKKNGGGSFTAQGIIMFVAYWQSFTALS